MRIRTGYSFKAATGHLSEVMARLKALEWPVAPISDRMSTFGFAKWTKLCKKEELRPVYGVELAVVPVLGEKKPRVAYWTFFAKEHISSVNAIVRLATSNPGKEPSLDYKQAMTAPDLIKIAGEWSLSSEMLKYKKAKDVYIALSPGTPKGLFNETKKLWPMIAVSDNVYTLREDEEFYRVALGRKASNQTYPRHILSDKEWIETVDYIVGGDRKAISEAIKNRAKAISVCKATLTNAELYVPEKKKTLLQMCKEGAKAKGVDLTNPVYKERLKRELSLIEKKNFGDYFYIIADLVTWAKKEMIVGPARGSSCGSLVCYLLHITEIDPIPYGLIFERFIDLNRSDLPDIDIDFSDERRELVFEYAANRFGEQNIARLGTVGVYKSRSALKRTADSLWIPTWVTDKVADSIVQRSSADSRVMNTLEDALADSAAGQKMIEEFPESAIVTRLEGHPNNPSQHAAGIVVTKRPIINYVAIDSRTNTAMCDKKDAELLNLLKIDALGLTQLSIFENVARRIGIPDRSGWLEKLPLHDMGAFEVLNKKHYAGIFQFQGAALQSIAQQIKIDRLEDIIALTALARPGPLATGGAQKWVERRNGKEEVTSLHPMLTELTKDTYGIVAYQEQVMNIVRHMGRMSWEDTSSIRKGMSGSLGDEYFSKYTDKFIKGAKENGIDEETAKEIWRNVNTFGSWAFNRSHAVAYGIVSYWCCYLKSHYPLEFAAASLDAEVDPVRQLLFLRELDKEGIGYVPTDAKVSTDRWEIEEKRLVGPLTAIKGIGPATMHEIMLARKKGTRLSAAVTKRIENGVTEIDSLYPIKDAVKRIAPDLEAIGITSKQTDINQIQCGVQGSVMAIGIVDKIAPRDLNDLANVAKRGYKLKGADTMVLNIFLRDDEDRIFCRINRQDYQHLALPVIERGKPGKVIYAIKGTVPKDFRMISVTNLRYIGDIKEAPIEAKAGEASDD